LSEEDIELSIEIRRFVQKNYDDVSIYAPLALGNHIDHRIVFEAACALIAFGYSVTFYEDLPYAGNYSLSQIEKEIDFLEKRTEKKFNPILLHSGISSKEKTNALNIYKTQLDGSTLEHILFHHNNLNPGLISYRSWVNQITNKN